jgi:HEAT repeat protein
MNTLAEVLLLTVVIIIPLDDPAKTAAPDAKQLKKLIRDLGADEFSVREKATQSLSDIGRPALPALREALQQSIDAEVRQRARRIMDSIQTSRKYLLESLKDPDPAQRKEAAEILERLGADAKPVVPALVEALKDKDETVRDAVINALLAIDPAAGALTRAIPAKAHVDGKYQKLLRRIRVPRDKQNYSDFSDYGHFEGTEWAGYTNLPPGYWVYVYPHWYIWEEQKQK